MDPKDWLNLRQVYRARFTAASSKMDSKISFARCKRGVRMCCARVGGVVGVVGAILLLLGLVQVASGIYFLLMLPIFQLGSNIWTGGWSCLCGLILGVIGWKKQTMRRGQVVLVATLSVLVANVANLVIVQVGEFGVFLTLDARRTIMEKNLDITLNIAFWLPTVVTAVGIVISFFGAQYLFCVVVRGSKVKGRMPVTRSLSEEGLHHRQETHDATPSLDDVVALPDPAGSSAWVYHPEEDKNPTPLYPMGLDLLSDFPDGSRRLPARHTSLVNPRYARVHQRPQRAQSFVMRRELQIAESHILRPPPPVACPEPPDSLHPSLYSMTLGRRIHRSNSVSGRMLLEGSNSGGTALSRKFHACSLDDLDSGPVFEVGMIPLERSRSEQSLTSIAQETTAATGTTALVHRSSSVQERLLDGKTVLTSFGPVNRPIARFTKPKGPAPPPPTKPKPTFPSVTQSGLKKDQNEGKDSCDATTSITTKDAEQKAEITTANNNEEPQGVPPAPEENLRDLRLSTGNTKRMSTLERHLPLPVIEENIKNTRKRPAPQPHIIMPSQSGDEPSREGATTLQADNPKSKRPEIVKPPRPSLAEKPLRLVDRNMTLARPCPVQKPERKRTESENAANLRKLEEVLTNILERGSQAPLRATKSDENIMESLKAFDTKMPKSILKKGSSKPSKYEVAHREALEDSKQLLDQLPRGELQRNKIVLRVPSFRTAGCQTEAYRPVRRRASCAQTNLSVAPRYKENTTSTNTSSRTSPPERWAKPERRTDPQVNSGQESSSSSSGYSSPEVGSKDPSPAHSGPPSPASSSLVASDEDERRTGANVTVIEVNKSETLPARLPHWHSPDSVPPPRPPKPLRLRHMSDAAAFMGSHGGLLVPVHRRASQLPYEDVFGLAALTENVMLLTEAINPVLVHSLRRTDAAESSSTTPRVVDVIRKAMQPTIQDDKPWDGRTTVVGRPRTALRAHSLSLPRPSLAHPSRTRLSRDSRSPSPPRNDDHSHQARHDTGPSTAAYLASLELLASHYRHQALANAKVGARGEARRICRRGRRLLCTTLTGVNHHHHDQPLPGGHGSTTTTTPGDPKMQPSRSVNIGLPSGPQDGRTPVDPKTDGPPVDPRSFCRRPQTTQ